MNPYEIEFSGKVHCKYCNIPIEVWSEKSFLNTYNGNSCKLYDECLKTLLNLDKLKITRETFKQQIFNIFDKYGDIADYYKTFNELLIIFIDLGELPDDF